MAAKSKIKPIKSRIKSLIWFLESPNFFFCHEKNIESQVAEKKTVVGKSKVGNCYSSVVHYFISLIMAQQMFSSSSPSSSPGPQCPCSGRSVRQAGEQKRKHGQETGTFCFLRCRGVPPRHAYLNMMAASRKGLAKRPMWPPGVLYIGTAATSGPPR